MILRVPRNIDFGNIYDEPEYEKNHIYHNIQINKAAMGEERSVILEACAKFSRFTQLHSLASKNNTPDERFKNDVFMEKFKEMISRYEDSRAPQKKIEALKSMRETYMAKAIDCQSANLSLKDIDELVESLYKLPFSGKTIQQSVEIQEESNKRMALKSPLNVFKLLFKKDK